MRCELIYHIIQIHRHTKKDPSSKASNSFLKPKRKCAVFLCVCLPYRRLLLLPFCCGKTNSKSCWLNIKKSTLDATRVIRRAFCYATICVPCTLMDWDGDAAAAVVTFPSGCFTNNFLKYFACCCCCCCCCSCSYCTMLKKLQHKHKVII